MLNPNIEAIIEPNIETNIQPNIQPNIHLNIKRNICHNIGPINQPQITQILNPILKTISKHNIEPNIKFGMEQQKKFYIPTNLHTAALCVTLHNFFPNNIPFEPIISCNKICLDTIFFHLNYFGKHFLVPKIFGTQNCFGSIFFCHPKFFWIKYFFTEIFLELTFFGPNVFERNNTRNYNNHNRNLNGF